MFTALRNVLSNEEGATMVEYGVMVALIAAVCVTIIGTLGQTVSGTFNKVNAAI